MTTNVTIDKVARISGVSAKTVSRVLRKKGSGYSDVTRAKVEAVAAQLGYAPNASARALASAKSFLIALVYDNHNADYVLQLQLGAARRCRQSGYHLVIKPVPAGEGGVAVTEKLVETTRLHGAILAPPLCENRAVIDLLARRGIACVRIAPNSDVPGTGAVRIEDRAASRKATEHVLQLGHRDIAFIGGPAHGPAAAERLAGFDAAIAAWHEEVRTWHCTGDFTFKSGFDHAMTLLGGLTRPTTIFAANDEMAFGVMAAANQCKLQVPHDLSVMGFDDTPAARIVRPQLTTVRQPIREMAAAAAAQLVQDVPGGGTVNISPELVLRRSTGPVMVQK